MSILLHGFADAQETVCAKVKIEIKQELTLERQAFEAEMRINNTTDSGVIENVAVVVKVTDENGTPVAITNDPNDLSAKFYIRQSSKENISDTDGTGTVNPKTTSTIDWILIPSPGSAGTSPLGKKYLVGASLQYRFGGEDTVLLVSPAVITVKPLPLLTLDYFLTQDVWADDPLTPAIEPAEPFTLGVRVKNTGYATAKNLKIDSAQPKIVENNQGLLINFVLTGSYVDDAPTQNTLLINFGDVPANTNRMGRWVMETTLAGKFTEFTARFSHSDELGGALTSLLQATNAHFLIRDVRVDLPGRDTVRDFLAQDGDVIRVYESDGPDTLVTDRSPVATLTATAGGNSNATYRLTFPPTAGFAYVRLPDPYAGAKALGPVVRSDAKQMLAENVWLSKTRNEQTHAWQYWINFFDVNSTGVYDSQFEAAPVAAQPPVLQFIPDRTTKEMTQVSFLVEASSAAGLPVTISATPLPAGATFTLQAIDTATPGLRRGVFDWTPALGTAGSYRIAFTATDGTLSSTRSATIVVQAATAPPGPGTPTIEAPLPDAQVLVLKPTLSVQTSTTAQDPTTRVQFELYADAAMTTLVASATVDKLGTTTAPVPTPWTVPNPLADNTRYWWRARAFDGSTYSNWVAARFFVNTFNDPPDSFNLTSPAPNAEVASLTPTLAWTNSTDKDGDAITYSVFVYRDVAMTLLAAQVLDLAEDPSGTTSWVVPPEATLVNHRVYTWRVIAKDALGAQTPSLPRSFTVNTGNTAPSTPIPVSPINGAQSTTPNTLLRIRASKDDDGDVINYIFEIDTVNTFDSADKQTSGPIVLGKSRLLGWTASNLVENKHYWWRVKAQDGRAESPWAVADFLMNAVNDPPPAPTVSNPGNGAWSTTVQPTLEANPVVDPEGDPVRYQFEVYRDAALTIKVADGVSATTAFIVPVPLADKTTHWWHVRALDPQSATSAWSATAVLYISTGPYQNPTIAMTSPAVPTTPTTVLVNGVPRKQVTLAWDANDPNVDATVALYFTGGKFSSRAGSLIVDGLRQPSGPQSGSYVWDVTDVTSGTYRVYGLIYDAKGQARAYAAGTVVIPSAVPAGAVVVSAPSSARVIPGGPPTTITVRLASAPTDDVVVPLSSSDPRAATLSPPSLTFTPDNWANAQTATVLAKSDCVAASGAPFEVRIGPTVSADIDYFGTSAAPLTVATAPAAATLASTNNGAIRICGLSVVGQRKVNASTWEYTVKARLTGLGAGFGGVTATLRTVPAGMKVVSGTLVFGAVGAGDSARSSGTVVLQAGGPVAPETFDVGLGFAWDVVVKP